MLQALRKIVALPRVPAEVFAATGTLAAFLWLLAHGFVQPVAVYLLELFLIF